MKQTYEYYIPSNFYKVTNYIIVKIFPKVIPMFYFLVNVILK